MGDETTRKNTGLSPRQMFLLDAACHPLRRNFPGYGPYLVGSAMTGERSAGQRDVDVRHIVGDEEYADLLRVLGTNGIRFLGIAVGQYLASITGLPIDFQFQQMTAANELHPGTSRNPLGLRGMGHFLGDGEPVSRPGQPAQPAAAPSAAGGADGGAGRG